MRKGSKEAKAWGRKMKRLRGKPKTKTRKRSTRKGQRRKTSRRAYTGLKRRKTRATKVLRRKKSESVWNW